MQRLVTDHFEKAIPLPSRPVGVSMCAEQSWIQQAQVYDAARRSFAHQRKRTRNDESPGFEKLRLFQKLFKLLALHGTEYRLPALHFKAAASFTQAITPALFSADYDAALPKICKLLACQTVRPMVFIEMPRRFGKTTLLCMLTAVLLYIQGTCEVNVYSLGQRAANLLCQGVKIMLRKLGELIGRPIKFENDSADAIRIVNYWGTTSRMFAYPATPDVRMEC